MNRCSLPSPSLWNKTALALVAALAVSAAGFAAGGDDQLRYNNLGIAYLAQFKPAEAERQFRLAVEADPNYVVGHVNIGIAALAQVHYDEALAAFKKALELDPANTYAHFNLSLIYKLQGRPEEALAEGQKALELDSRDPDIRYHVGSLYMTTRNYDRAIQEFETVIKLDPNFLSAYYSIGRAYMTKGEVDKGKRYIEKHRELQAGASAKPAVGLRYGEQGKYSFAMEDTGSAGPTPPLEPGVVTFNDVTAGSGIDFVSSAAGGIDTLKEPAGGDGPARLRDSVGPLMGGGLAVADVDGDGLEDLFFVNPGPAAAPSSLYLNQGGMKFRRITGTGAPEVAEAGMSASFGDLDSDGDTDLVVVLQDRVLVFTNDGTGKFSDVTAGSGAEKTRKGLLGGVSLADVDHDGDLDIFVAGMLAAPEAASEAPAGKTASPVFARWKGPGNLLFINATPPPDEAGSASGLKFTESAATMLVEQRGQRATGAVFSDLDNDRDIDFVLASPGDRTTVFSNMRDGTFTDLGARAGLPDGALILGLAAGDYDKDGWMDLAATTWEGGLPRLYRNVQAAVSDSPAAGGAFAADIAALAEVARQLAVPQFGVAFLDFDNDGYLDLATVNGDNVGPALFLYRNDGEGRFVDAGDLTGAAKIASRGGRGLATADLDGDGDLDLIITNAGAGPTLLRNDGGNKGHWLRIAPEGLHSNKPAIGTKVEVKAGRLWQKQEVISGSGYLSQGSIIPHFGLGPRDRVDTVRLLWPGGVLQDEVQVAADSVYPVQELDRKGSSCPILYAWNGERVEFVSDFLGGSAIGYRTGLHSFNYPDTDEYVKIGGSQLQPRNGELELRMVNQLEETIYFDRARLLVVDHPGDTEIFPDERLMPSPPFPSFRVFPVAQSHVPEAVVNDAGDDLREAVSRIDRVYAGPPAGTPRGEGLNFKGYAPEHSITLDLGSVENDAPLVLLLHGWIDYADSTSNLAAAQAGLALVPPYLEALDEADPDGKDQVLLPGGGTARRGRWVRVLPQMGFPAGLPKTMTVDLTGKLPDRARIVRIGTSMRIHWDQIRVATRLGPPPAMTALEASAAELRYRGFPALVSPDGRAPEAYDYEADQAAVFWKTHLGRFTRYGDVRPLLREVDDRYVITRPGDEIVVTFPAEGMPPLPQGWQRDYLLFADGFGKDMDVNSARPDAVTPLPYHGMASYPPPAGEGYPYEREDILEYLDAYNTRLITAPLSPIAPGRSAR